MPALERWALIEGDVAVAEEFTASNNANARAPPDAAERHVAQTVHSKLETRRGRETDVNGARPRPALL